MSATNAICNATYARAERDLAKKLDYLSAAIEELAKEFVRAEAQGVDPGALRGASIFASARRLERSGP